ncbi:MAG TPA: alpha/beta hydrolase [Rhabdochlamydiaceae bacterium]|jgi:hypothetical protein|nr:alpha/beta hydrolase [Rhabdochlamydiaceae bacterium]
MPDPFGKKSFIVDSAGFSLKGDCSLGEGEPILFLHGAGTSTRYQFDLLRQQLWSNKIQSLSFDFVGHGETGGVLQSSSLKHRLEQACHIIETIKLKEPLSVIAESMSGYTAIKLLEKYEVKNLILLVPAVYHVDSYSISFNQGFSEIIRQPKSWLHSDAWEILQTFQGNLLICFAEKDTVIPKEIIDRLYDSAKNTQSKNLYLIQGSPHKTWEYLAQNQQERERLFMQIIDTLKA